MKVIHFFLTKVNVNVSYTTSNINWFNFVCFFHYKIFTQKLIRLPGHISAIIAVVSFFPCAYRIYGAFFNSMFLSFFLSIFFSRHYIFIFNLILSRINLYSNHLHNKFRPKLENMKLRKQENAKNKYYFTQKVNANVRCLCVCLCAVCWLK